MKILLHAGDDIREITDSVLGNLASLPTGFFRRSEILSLISSTLSISPNKICAWTDFDLQPGFLSHINPITPVSKYIYSSHPTPDAPDDVLDTQERILVDIAGDYINTHLSRLNWIVDPRINEIHIALFDDIMKSVGDNREKYLTRVYPWSLGASSSTLTSILAGEELGEILVEDPDIVRTRLTKVIPRLTEDLFYEPVITTMNCEFRSSTIDTINGTTNHLGYPTEKPLNPYADKPVHLDIANIFKSLIIDERYVHAIAYCDPKQPTNGKIRIATSDDRDGSILRSVLSKQMIQYFRSPIIRRHGDDIQVNVPYEEGNTPYLRVVYSLKGKSESSVISESLLSEAIIYEDGHIQTVLVNPDDLLKHTHILETITGNNLRPITQEVIFQLFTGKVFDDTYTREQKREYLRTRLLLDDTIAKSIDSDDPSRDLLRIRYNRVNLPETVKLTETLNSESIRQIVTIMILAGVEISQIILRMSERKISPGKVIGAIGLLPPDKEERDYRSYTQVNRAILRNALQIFVEEMDREREEKELERIRSEEGGEEMAPDIQFAEEKEGGLTIFAFGCPDITTTNTLLKYITNSFIKEVPEKPISPIVPVRTPTKDDVVPVPSNVPVEDDFELDLGLGPGDDKTPSPPKPPAEPPAEPPSEAPMEDDFELDLGLGPDDDKTPSSTKAPTEAPMEDDFELDLGLGPDDDKTPSPPKPPAEAPAEAPIEDDFELDLGIGTPSPDEGLGTNANTNDDDSQEAPEPSPPKRTPSSSPKSDDELDFEKRSEQTSSSEDSTRDSISFGRKTQTGRGRAIGTETLYDPTYPINRLRNKPLTEADKKAKRTRYARTSVFQDIYENNIFDSKYARDCRKGLQPIMITQEEYEKFKQERPGAFGYMNATNDKLNKPIASDDPKILKEHYGNLMTEKDEDLWGIPYKGAWFICPKYWSMSEEIPLYKEEVKDEDIYDTRTKDKKARGRINRGRDVYLSYDYHTDPVDEVHEPYRIKYPGYRKPDGKPCCFKITPRKEGEDLKRYNSKMYDTIKTQQSYGRPEDGAKMGTSSGAAAAAGAAAGASAAGATAAASAAAVAGTTNVVEKDTMIVQEDLRWNSRKDFLLPSTDILDLIGLTGFQDRCNDVLKKYTKGLQSLCVVRKPDPINYYYDSLFRSLLTIYHFTRGAVGKETPIQTPTDLANSIVKYVNAERFRLLHDGALVRTFLPDDDNITGFLNDRSDTFLYDWVVSNDLPEQFNTQFINELELNAPSDFLIRWAISHTRFIEHTLSETEPKSLNVYWEILTKHPWNILDMEVGGDSIFANGVNLFIVESGEPPFIVCPPEGRITKYYQEERPMAILIRNEMVYQPMILLTRHDTKENKQTKNTQTIQGVIYPNTELLTETSPEMLSLIRDLWKAVKNLPNHIKRNCAPETITPYSNAPSYEEVIETVKTVSGESASELVIDTLGRITGVAYKITPAPTGSSVTGGEAIKRIIIPCKPISQEILPGLPIIGSDTDTASYKEIKEWIQDFVKNAGDLDHLLVQNLKKLRPVIRKDIDSFSVVGIQINDGLIAPVSDLEKYSPDTLPTELKNAIITGWSRNTDSILTMQPSQLKEVRDVIKDSIRDTLRECMENAEFIRDLGAIRTNTGIPRHTQIQDIHKLLMDNITFIKLPKGVRDKDIPRVRDTIIHKCALILISPLVTSQEIRRITQNAKVSFPDTADREIHLTYQDLFFLRNSLLTIMKSSYINGNELFAINGASDPSYLSMGTRNTPIPIRNVWADKLQYNVNTSTSIRSRDGILSIRMLNFGNTSRNSWDSIAMSMRDHIENPIFEGDDLRKLLVRIWGEFFDYVGEDSWDKIKTVLRRESRGMIEDDYTSMTSFLMGLRTGRIDPGFTDLCLLTKYTRINFILIHGYSIGEEFTSVRYPMRIIAASPLNWNDMQYSILMRTPDRTETGRFTYAPVVGVRKGLNITGFKISKNHLPGTFVKMIEKIAETGTVPKWTNPMLTKWIRLHFNITVRD